MNNQLHILTGKINLHFSKFKWNPYVACQAVKPVMVQYAETFF